MNRSRTFWRTLLCAVFGGVFVYAGVLKALDPTLFLLDVRSFNLLPDPFAAWLALGLPWLEIAAGVAVMLGVGRLGGLTVLLGLLLVFLIVIGISWARGLDISCGCFGGQAEVSDYLELVVRDAILLALGVLCAVLAARSSLTEAAAHS